MPYEVSTAVFEGPFDLLLHLISQDQVDIYEVASHLWNTADELRANSHLKAAEYSIPVLGLIFLKFADSRFTEAEADIPPSALRTASTCAY